MAERLIRESDVIKLIDEWLDNYPLPRHVEKGLTSHEELLAYIAEAPTIEATKNEFWKSQGAYETEGGKLYIDLEGGLRLVIFEGKIEGWYIP